MVHNIMYVIQGSLSGLGHYNCVSRNQNRKSEREGLRNRRSWTFTELENSRTLQHRYMPSYIRKILDLLMETHWSLQPLKEALNI